jgi:hypothetical protein
MWVITSELWLLWLAFARGAPLHPRIDLVGEDPPPAPPKGRRERNKKGKLGVSPKPPAGGTPVNLLGDDLHASDWRLFWLGWPKCATSLAVDA